ncbi:hypothetical protein [Stutzerimonas kunmingensis]|uniref:hypothetical protein n=1 Tax=Stutzerimonas kunmingensis TaxID=1211807 RepID=UPI001113F1DA|nr:hypothetical protein [Stutzerimonas kunmingensis]
MLRLLQFNNRVALSPCNRRESCWPDAMFDTRFFTMIEHLYLIFSRLAYSADVRANALRRVLK